MKKKCLHNQAGFSLIEVIIAMFILSVGLLAVGLMQISAMKGNTIALSRGDGVAYAQSVMDALRSTPLGNTLLVDNGGTDLDDGMASGGNAPAPAGADHTGTELFGVNPTPGLNGMDYTIFWNVDDDTPVAGAKSVRLFVYWTDQKFGLNRVVVTSVLGGLYL